MSSINLTIAERIVLLEILPQQGNMIEMILVHSITKKVEFTPEEIKECEIKGVDGSITWDPDRDVGVNITFEDAEKEILRGCYRDIDNDKKVTNRNYTLCLKLRDL